MQFLIVSFAIYTVVTLTSRNVDGYLEGVYQRCCIIGRDRSIGMTTCEGEYRFNLEDIPAGQRTICSMAVNLCCAQAIKDRECEEGKLKAKSGGTTCNLVESNTEEKSMRKYCCESCKLGLIFGSISKMCEIKSFRFGIPWDDVFRSCCSKLSISAKSVSSTLQTMNICDLLPGELCSQICIPKNGSYECRCSEGFYLTTDGKTCLKQINDPCKKLNPCDQICTSTENQAVCSCKDGFKLSSDNRTCVDINECQLNLHTCDELQRCDNTFGSYQCIRFTGCGTGYTLNSNTGECEDDDECSLGNDNCHTLGPSYECKNTLGSFRCVKRHCKNRLDCSDRREVIPTYTFASKISNTPRPTLNPDICIEKDECIENPRICEHECINTLCSYRCACRQGYKLHSDNRSCIDIDECKLFEYHNLCVGICINQPGSYKCHCPPGYKLGFDAISCQDIDECLDENLCKKDGGICLNIRGDYRCNHITCPVNYITDPDHQNRCKRAPGFCIVNTPECMKMPTMYSFHYITFASNIKIAPTSGLNLFSMRGPIPYNSSITFFLNVIEVQAPPGILKATKENFKLSQIGYNQAIISLVKSIQGPQEIELNLIMRFTYNTVHEGFSISKLFIYVSKYEF